jgi:hypothetical protein
MTGTSGFGNFGVPGDAGRGGGSGVAGSGATVTPGRESFPAAASASASVPPVPESVRAPSILDDIPVVPFQYPTPGK